MKTLLPETSRGAVFKKRLGQKLWKVLAAKMLTTLYYVWQIGGSGGEDGGGGRGRDNMKLC